MLQRRPWSLPPLPPPEGIWLEGPKLRHALRRWQARISRVLGNTNEGRRPPEVDYRPARTGAVRRGIPPGDRVYDTGLGAARSRRPRARTTNGVRLDQPLQGAGVPGSPLQGQTLVPEGSHPGTCRGVPSKD